MDAPGKKASVALQWLSNPVVIWGGSVIGVAAIVYFFLPSLYNGAKGAAKKAFSDISDGFSSAVDSGQANLSSIIGAGTNLPNQGVLNEVRQTVAPGGRGLSDIADAIGLGS